MSKTTRLLEKAIVSAMKKHDTYSELSQQLNVSKATISKWRDEGDPKMLIPMLNLLSIYQEDTGKTLQEIVEELNDSVI